ncbi:hypothetical protein [Pontiella sulfatireligans]|uniref:CinA C-terminal domain-containing protein n=1 Tax=Pontiella sulfatireligans TaxID=2750658 RepID=A0A6C2UF55_9BACT|nr:hypothetical protein [Pontiella sulfatireligans]VGO18051.1 hypothetical protein SCARR_00101 [Pontiella sulfatireligans]
MKGECDKLIENIQSSGWEASIVATGGGSGAVHALLSHPGASRFVLETQIPYSAEALSAYLGYAPAQGCSKETGRLMASRALERAHQLQVPDSKFKGMGIACTAALQTNRQRKGADRAFIYIKSTDREASQVLELARGTRAEQEEALSEALLKFIAEFVVEVEP